MRVRPHEEIDRLFLLAKNVDENLARRYVTLARKLASRSRFSLRKYNRVHCRKCNTYWNAHTLRVRTTRSSVVYTCLHCGERKRFRKN